MKKSIRLALENTVLAFVGTGGIVTLWQQMEKHWYGEVQPRNIDSVVMFLWLAFGAFSYIEAAVMKRKLISEKQATYRLQDTAVQPRRLGPHHLSSIYQPRENRYLIRVLSRPIRHDLPSRFGHRRHHQSIRQFT